MSKEIANSLLARLRAAQQRGGAPQPDNEEASEQREQAYKRQAIAAFIPSQSLVDDCLAVVRANVQYPKDRRIGFDLPKEIFYRNLCTAAIWDLIRERAIENPTHEHIAEEMSKIYDWLSRKRSKVVDY